MGDLVKTAKTDYFESVKEVHNSAAGLRSKVVEAGVPEDHVDSMVTRWVTAAEACDGKAGAEMDECYKKAAECPFKAKVQPAQESAIDNESTADDASAPEQPSYLKLLRLKRLFSAMYQKLEELVKQLLA